jgi:hypothetical protein
MLKLTDSNFIKISKSFLKNKKNKVKYYLHSNNKIWTLFGKNKNPFHKKLSIRRYKSKG